ncbi:MAG: c-type cytochrome [Alphaproteobacteria bacterium]|nr:c-type cytochrome [Alphaproteobacteria bacterium]
MSDLESNKIFAAVLCTGVTVMLTGFVANKLVKSEKLKEDAVAIEGALMDSHGGETSSAVDIPEPILALLASADLERGAKISKACIACHSFDKGGAVKQGPAMWNVVMRDKGTSAGFAYSDALKASGGKWTYDSLNKFLDKPKDYIPGTKMNFIGLKKAEDRAAIIAWMREKADSPAPLPSQAEIDAAQAAYDAAIAPPAEAEHAPEVENGTPVDSPAH